MFQLVMIGSAFATAPAGDWSKTNVEGYSDNSVVVGDFNGDGYDDLLFTVYYTGSEDVYEGSATGLRNQPSYSLVLSGATTDRHVLDVDGDGYDDLAVTSGRDIYVYYGSASGLIDTWRHTVTGPTNVFSIATGDLQGDGYDDLVFAIDDTNANAGNVVYWWPGSAIGLTQFPAFAWTGGLTFATRGLAVVDANGDGYDDLALGGGGYYSRDVKVYLGSAGTPAGNFYSVVSPPNGTDYFGEEIVNAGDLDGDGDEDLACSVYDTVTRVYSYAVVEGGVAGLSPATVTPGVNNTVPNMVSMGDTDLDGDDELLLGIPTYDTPAPGAVTDRGVVAVLKYGANNRFTMPVAGDYAMGSNASENTGASVASGDFDGTGLRDMVTTSPGAGYLGRIDVFYDVP